MRKPRSTAFTLVELLTVIAILAVLAALLFPVFSRAREGARQTTCMSNMHQMYVGASLYRDDWNGYPCMLLGYAEQAGGLPWTEGVTAPVVAASKIEHGYLFPAYIKNIEAFHCPDNRINDPTKVTEGELSEAAPIFQKLKTNQSGHT
jgi:prepilin-type N-terminal cleavage/methylation domain-containing protein